MKRYRGEPLLLALVGLALMGLAAAAWLGRSGRPTSQVPSEDACAVAVRVTAPAPDVRLTSLAGDPVSLEGLQGSVVVFNTWASWCPPCRDELPALEAVWRRYREADLVVVGANIGETQAAVQTFIDRSGLTFPIWLDPDEDSMRAFATISLPSTFLIDPTGTVRARWMGATCERELEAAILPLLEEKEAP